MTTDDYGTHTLVARRDPVPLLLDLIRTGAQVLIATASPSSRVTRPTPWPAPTPSGGHDVHRFADAWPADGAKLVESAIRDRLRADTGGDGGLSHGRTLGRATIRCLRRRRPR